MINISFTITNIFGNQEFDNLFSISGKLVGNKCWEFEIHRVNSLLGFNLSTDWSGCDHAGPELELTLFGYNVNIKIYDIRHWDYENHCWSSSNNE